jgi:nitrogen fixation/metabolism regulation signal transduction histidine kinase
LIHAATTVGAGDLETRLPPTRGDEFGNVYESFNRMVGRLDRTRAALVQETRRTETIVAEAATGVLALDAEGRVELINPRAAEILDGTVDTGDLALAAGGRGSALSLAIAGLMNSPAQDAVTEVEIEGRTVRMRLRRLSGDGAGGGGGAVIALEDVTAEMRTARVIAWGEMARQVAHEIKNPLTPIKLSVQHLRRAFEDQRPDFDRILQRNVDSILREIDRLSEISRAFARFGTPTAVASPLERVDAGQAVREVSTLYRGADGGVEIELALSPDSPLVIARAGEIKEVLLNLLENAREAVDPEGGHVVISMERDEDPAWWRLEVEDDGVGIQPDQLSSIFEPHFSTRSSGTGLGLAIVRRIVESWGGEIAVVSDPGVRTRFTIRLRAAAAGAGNETSS